MHIQSQKPVCVRLGMTWPQGATLERSFSSQLIWVMHACSHYLSGCLSKLSWDLQGSGASWKFDPKVRTRAAAEEWGAPPPFGSGSDISQPPANSFCIVSERHCRTQTAPLITASQESRQTQSHNSSFLPPPDWKTRADYPQLAPEQSGWLLSPHWLCVFMLLCLHKADRKQL